MNNTPKATAIKATTITRLTLTCSAIILAALLVTSQPSQADENQQSSKRRGPPPEAFTACEGKNAGESSQFKSQRGKTLTGTCEVVGGENAGELVLRPDNRPDKQSNKQQQNGKRRSPPQEAFTACEGKTAGESSQFESRRGEMLTGTCEDANGKLVLRPERFNN